MWDQSESEVSFVQFSEDAPLNKLYNILEEREDFTMGNLHMKAQQRDQQKYDVEVNHEEVEKGYDSDEGQAKKGKNKRIKKKKYMLIERQEENKKRRIKSYIESLENKVIELQAENDRLKKINELNIGYIKKLGDSEQIINGFFIDRQKVLERIQRLTEASEPDSIKINMQCQTLHKRQGIYGKERVKAINYYFKQLLHMILPNVQKYITQAACNQTDIFSRQFSANKQKQAQKLQFLKNLSPNDQFVSRFVQKKQALVALKRKFNNKVLEMYQNKCNIMKIVRQMEIACEEVAQSSTPLQRGRFFCYAEKHKQETVTRDTSLIQMYSQLQNCSRFSYENQNLSISYPH